MAITGCQKEKKELYTKQGISVVQKAPLSRGHAVDKSDSAGIRHNLALRAMIESSRMNGGTNWDECVIFLDGYFVRPENADRGGIITYAKRMVSEDGVDPEEVISALPYSVAAKRTIRSVLDANRTMQSPDTEALENRLRLIVANAERQLAPAELEVVKELASIARHSSRFWENYFGHQPVPPVGEGLLKILWTIHADNMGYLCGILFGDPEFGASLFSASGGFGIANNERVDI
nr:hypothetical protein [uncultured Sphingobacterium sp.]